MEEDIRARLHTLIDTEVLNRAYTPKVFDEDKNGWIFDFRSVLLSPEKLNLITEALWKDLNQPDHVQIGGMESAAIPIITSLVLRAHSEGKHINGFYIRKSRKKSGLFRQVEGVIEDTPIILVDDLLNSGRSLMRQVSVLESLGKRVSQIITVVRFEELTFYTDFTEKGIKISSLFSLEDFKLQRTMASKSPPRLNPYITKWAFAPSVAANNGYVVPRSVPVITQNEVLFGNHSGSFWALDKTDGQSRWRHTMGHDPQEKVFLSSPATHNGCVFFGGYDGKLYALDCETGLCRWIFSDCEWIGSSPSVAIDSGLVYIGLEHGMPGRRGSIACLRAETGERVWEYETSALMHSSPLYIKEHAQVCIGGNEGSLYLLDAHTGDLVWRFESEGGRRYDGRQGFSPGDIKMRPAYDVKDDVIAFCSMDGYAYILDRKTAQLRSRTHTEDKETSIKAGIYGSPVFHNRRVIFAALDKRVYCYDYINHKYVWKFATSGRIFGTPTIYNMSVFIGSNDGCLYELDVDNGTARSLTQFSERITSEVIVDQDDSVAYVVLQTGELHALDLKTYAAE